MRLNYWGAMLVFFLAATNSFAQEVGVEENGADLDMSDLQPVENFAEVEAIAEFLGFTAQNYDRRPPRPALPPPRHRPPPPPPYYPPPPHRPPPPPPPPVYYYTCYAEDAYGRVFWARDQYARWAQDTAMYNCQRMSYGCRPTGCYMN